ncbi:hypothetical protein EVJ58_g3449 [Rhodofomes roseus]|uniref:Uncharacterized protein n=1 Tax=Rhodofomes roseus TaxID=34475 RepID=A0A4Y9YKP7_9APHY|nr:hypothetical protein EVJ58_g3449 [Rhodofomes roseus]
MDPFSTAAAGLDVLGLVIKSLQNLFLYAKSVKNAPRAVQKLQEELVTTQGTFKFAEHTFQSLQQQRLSEHAITGSGKTILAASVIKGILKFEERDEALAFHFCDFSEAESTNAVEVLRALLTQLIQSGGTNRLSRVPKLIARMKEKKPPPASIPELEPQLVAAADGRRVIIVLDALDECPTLSKTALLECLSRLVLHEAANVRLLLCSRKHEDIANALCGCLSICLEATDESRNHYRDMELYIDDTLRTRDRLSDLPLDAKVRVKDVLLKEADGMFRWVDCQFDMLCRRGWTIGGIERALSSLPHGLEPTYERIFIEIEQNGDDALAVVNRALMWLVTTLRPLTENEILEALMIEKGKPILNQGQRLWRPADLLDLCSSLVYVEPTTGCIRLSHYSVKEFVLFSQRARRFLKPHVSDLSAVRSETSKLILTYLMADDFGDTPRTAEPPVTALTVDEQHSDRKWRQETVLDEHPFALYAAPWWSDHLRRVDKLDEELRQLAVAFVAQPVYRRKVHNWLRHHYKELKSIFSYGLDVARSIADQNAALLDEDITLNGTPLINAISRSDRAMVAHLLQAGADPDRVSSSPSSHGGAYLPTTPLWFALRTENNDLVQLLLDYGATIHSSGSPDFDAMLRREVEIHTEDRERRSTLLPVHVPSTRRDPEAQQQISGGTDVTIRASPGGMIVPYVARPDALFVETMRLLTDAGHDERNQKNLGLTALQVACMLRSTDMVVCLLQNGADVGEICEPWLGQSDLEWATSEWWCPERLRYGSRKLNKMGFGITARGVSSYDGVKQLTPDASSVASDIEGEDLFEYNDTLYTAAVALFEVLNMTMNCYLLDECEPEPLPEYHRLAPLHIACMLRDAARVKRLLSTGGAEVREAHEPWLSSADMVWVRKQRWWKDERDIIETHEIVATNGQDSAAVA